MALDTSGSQPGQSRQAGEVVTNVMSLQRELRILQDDLSHYRAKCDSLEEHLAALQTSRTWRALQALAALKNGIRALLAWPGETLGGVYWFGRSLCNATVGLSAKPIEDQTEASPRVLRFDLGGTRCRGEVFYELHYQSPETLIGPRFCYLVAGEEIEENAYVYENLQGHTLFGTIDIPREADALLFYPSRIANDATVQRFHLRKLTWLDRPFFNSFWYRWWRMYGGAWVKERMQEDLRHRREAFPHSAARDYQAWWQQYARPETEGESWQHQRDTVFALRPTISIIMPVYNAPPRFLAMAFDSVIAQSYPCWELCIADDCSSDAKTLSTLRHYAAMDERIRLVEREQNGHISAASNSALAMAGGDYVCFLDHDDELSPQALFRVVERLNENSRLRLIYSDEDIIDKDNKHLRGHLKPDWNPDLLRSINYICHLLVLDRALLDQLGGLREGYEGAQDYDLVLRASAMLRDDEIGHIPKILYHWRAIEGSTAADVESKRYAKDAGLAAVRDYFSGIDSQVLVSQAEIQTAYRPCYPVPNPAPLVSIIVPTRNGLNLLRHSIESVRERTCYPNYELIVVDNQSDDPAVIRFLTEIQEAAGVRVLTYDSPFNFSAINNYAVGEAKGQVLLFLNNDIEVVNEDWLNEMVSHALRPEIGAVGAKLFYPNNTLQHAGVVLGLGPDKVAGHACKSAHKHEVGALGRLRLIQNYSAVTAACLAIERSKWLEVGGFEDQRLQIAFNDVDLCLKLLKAGYRNLWTPYAQLYHFESISRGYDSAPEKQERFLGECRYMRDKWSELLDNDPAYNPNLTRESENFSMSWPPAQCE